MSELTPKQIRLLEKAKKFGTSKELATAESFMELEEKVDQIAESVDTRLNSLSEELKKKLESELVLEIDREELKGEVETLKNYFGDGDVHIQFIGVDESARGKGIATKTLQIIIEDNPKAKTFSAEPTNKVAFDLNVKVFGKPTEISDDIRDLTLKEAREKLPDVAKYNDGELDSTSRVFVRFNKPKIKK
jgi:GNAT superfamily N-acetyltransferase